MELVLKRREIQDEINAALNCNGTPYDFAKWQRTIRWRYADHPLCTKGSLALGGRFNIGKNIDPSIFPPFCLLCSKRQGHFAPRISRAE